MSIAISSRTISRIHIIDDDRASRKGYGFTVDECDVETVLQDDRVEDVCAYIKKFGVHDAIVSDFHLKKASSYFPINGAEFVALCYDNRIPSVLVTRYENSSLHEIRPFKEKIPLILSPDELNTESLVFAFQECVNEFEGRIAARRKPWRTLVRVEEIVDSSVILFVPAWNPHKAIELKLIEFPQEIRSRIHSDLRFFAKVNIEAENINDLFFSDWEIKNQK